MSSTRKYSQWSSNSPLYRVPVDLRVRCQRTGCLGSECPSWRNCSPVTAFGGYGARFAALPVPAAPALVVKTPSVPA